MAAHTLAQMSANGETEEVYSSGQRRGDSAIDFPLSREARVRASTAKMMARADALSQPDLWP